MVKLALVAAGLWGGHRYLKARELGVSVDRAFKFDNLLTSIDDLAADTTEPTPTQLDAAATQEDRRFGPAAVNEPVPRKVFRRAYGGTFLPGADDDDYLTPEWM